MAVMSEKSTRVSLTKKHSLTEEGIKLLDLCKEFTSDGILSDDEIKTLGEFIEAQDDKFPAIPFLKGAFTEYKNTNSEHYNSPQQIYKSIEKILPVIDRKISHNNRIEIEKSERQRNQCIQYNNFMVAGCKRKERAGNVDLIEPGYQVELEREYDNEKDEYAVLVYCAGLEIGYVPKIQSEEVALMLDSDTKYISKITKLLGDYSDKKIPVVDVRFYHATADIPQQSNLKFIQHSKTKNAGCFNLLIVFVFIAIVLAALLH